MPSRPDFSRPKEDVERGRGPIDKNRWCRKLKAGSLLAVVGHPHPSTPTAYHRPSGCYHRVVSGVVIVTRSAYSSVRISPATCFPMELHNYQGLQEGRRLFILKFRYLPRRSASLRALRNRPEILSDFLIALKMKGNIPENDVFLFSG